MKIMLLGYTTVGKTHFLGSLFKLNAAGECGFSVQPRDVTALGAFEKIYDTVARAAAIPASVSIRTAEMVLKKNVEDVEELDIIDIEGQAIGGTSPETAKQILKLASECEAFVVVVNTPADEEQFEQASNQLAQCLNFVSQAIHEKKGVPVSLILNKLDILPQAKGLKAEIEKKKQELSQSQTSPERIIWVLENKLGEEIVSLIEPSVKTVEIYKIIRLFFNRLGRNIPNKVFMCTSSGFDSVASGVKTPQQLMPFGTGAAFLWTIYARLKMRQQSGGIQGKIKPDKVADELLEDIRKLHTSGKAYFNNNEELWSFRNVGYLDHSEAWGK